MSPQEILEFLSDAELKGDVSDELAQKLNGWVVRQSDVKARSLATDLALSLKSRRESSRKLLDGAAFPAARRALSPALVTPALLGALIEHPEGFQRERERFSVFIEQQLAFERALAALSGGDGSTGQELDMALRDPEWRDEIENALVILGGSVEGATTLITQSGVPGALRVLLRDIVNQITHKEAFGRLLRCFRRLKHLPLVEAFQRADAASLPAPLQRRSAAVLRWAPQRRCKTTSLRRLRRALRV